MMACVARHVNYQAMARWRRSRRGQSRPACCLPASSTSGVSPLWRSTQLGQAGTCRTLAPTASSQSRRRFGWSAGEASTSHRLSSSACGRLRQLPASSSAAAASAAGSSAAAPEAALPGPRPSTLADLLEGKLDLAIAEPHSDKASLVDKLARMSASGGGRLNLTRAGVGFLERFGVYRNERSVHTKT